MTKPDRHTVAGGAALCALFAAMLISAPAFAQDSEGTVRVPLSRWEELTTGESRNPAVVRYAFSNVVVNAVVNEEDDGATAEVVVTATVNVLGNEWTVVPFASIGGALTSATVDGRAAPLIARDGVMGWPTNATGSHQLRWTYSADARRYGDGRVLSLATPEASGQLTVTLDGTDRGVTVIPAADVSSQAFGSQTRITATLPATGAAQVAWRSDDAEGFTLSRAHYQGVLSGDTVHFEAELTVELSADERARVPLFPIHIALEEVRVDRTEAPIAVEEGMFVVPLRGRGRHRISASFQVPVMREDGLPRIDLQITPTPVSRFEITLPGEREVSVEPMAGVISAHADGQTVGSFHVPMSSNVTIRWAEAVPQDAAAVETRAHAEIVHVVRPDEGVLSMRAFATWEISRGTLSRATIDLPEDVQVIAVESSAGVVSDWRVGEVEGDRVLDVFLDREVADALALEIRYERAWPVRTRTSQAFDAPLLRVRDVHRQRGMIALLASRELTLEPQEEEHMTRVGDNVLPAHIRDRVEGTVAHTWRYLDEPPVLIAVGAERDPEPARFDAQVDTLVSLGEVSTTVTALIDIDVKSGALDVLSIVLPEGLNLLDVSAPSLRQHTLEERDDGSRELRIELTQPMEGQFRVEVITERITAQDEDVLEIPVVDVDGAEVERGRLGVEALAAFQVDAAEVERLTPVDPSELPEQLLLRTDNPILHAYRYAQADPAPRFTVRITRHQEIETPHAVIDEASYRTLYTRDGVAVTVASFTMRNRRQQFLRVGLPEGSEVWSATVDGRPETPALESGSDEDEPIVLLNIVSAADAFAVQLVYATRVAELGAFGRLSAELPELDVVVTRSRWEVFLPNGAVYAEPSSDMTLIESGHASLDEAAQLASIRDAFAIDVPADGVRYVFTKMYAGRSGERVAFSIPYASGWGGPFATGVSLLGSLFFCLGLLAFLALRFRWLPSSLDQRLPVSLATYRDNHYSDSDEPELPRPLPRRTMTLLAGLSAFGGLLLVLTLGYLSVSVWPAGLIVGLVGLGGLGMIVRTRMESRRAEPVAEEEASEDVETGDDDDLRQEDELSVDEPVEDPSAS